MEDDEFVQAVEASRKHQQKVLADVLKKGPYGKKVVGKASQMASTFAEDDGLHPTLDVENREWRYTLKQGLRAACVGREDAAALLIVMSTVLDNQKTIKRLLWGGLALLVYIAYKV